MKSIQLRFGKERSLMRRHPWVFATSIANGRAGSGETVRLEDEQGRFLATAAFSPSSKIQARVWSFNEAEPIDHAFFKRRIDQALAYRERMVIDSDAVRLIHGEADGLPGLIVDRYGKGHDAILCAQFLSAGTERWKTALATLLVERTGIANLYERSDSGVRALEGLNPASGWLHRADNRDLLDISITIHEHQWQLTLDVAEGHKTGFYLDQRDNRLHFMHMIRQFGLNRVLNCYCYTGGFTIAALAGGAQSVTSVDSSAPALERARAHVALNGFAAERTEFLDADVNATLRKYQQNGETFDAIVLDPPKFAPTAAHAERAARAYKDINRLALKLLNPGGILYTFSCSGGIAPDLFHKIVAGAAMDAGVDGYIYARLGAAADHPQTLAFPEGEYLKGLVIVKK